MGLVSELRRRNVLRMAVLYAVAAWLILQVAEVLIDLAKLPDWIGTTILWLLAVGFPIALIFSWFYEITPAGISLEKDVDPEESITHVTGRRLEFIVISLLCAGLILFAYDKWWIGPPPEKSIAVLAFTNMSGDPDQEYFSDGISEELLNVLAQIPELRVISRSSSFSFKGKDIAIPTVAKQLNVAHVLEGSVRKMGNRVRITAQLIEASSDSHLWSQSYDRELDDIFAVQDEIAGAISHALKVKLALVAGVAVQPTVIKAADTVAYDAYLRARELIRLRGRENLEEAVRHLERSLRLDEGFAPAHAQLAIATTLLWTGAYGTLSLEDVRRQAIPHLDRAEALEPLLADVHAGRALLASISRDPVRSVEHAERALALNPSYTDPMVWLSNSLADLGRYEESDATERQMLVTDPLNHLVRFNNIIQLAALGQVEEAHELADELLAQNPGWGAMALAHTSYEFEGKIAESLSWALKGQATNLHRGTLILAFVSVGEYDEALRVFGRRRGFIDFVEGRFDEAIQVTRQSLQLAPTSEIAILRAAGTLYAASRFDEARPLFERLHDFTYQDRPMRFGISEDFFLNVMTMRLALARRKTGDEDGARAAAEFAKQDHAARHAAGRKNQYQHRAEAMLAAFENDPEGVMTALTSAIQSGLRERWFFDDPIFEDFQDDSRFIRFRQELDAIISAEHDKVLQLICFNNPTPDDWQPLPETCEGVVQQLEL